MDESKEKHSIDTEELILQAAEREFMLKGFAGARTTTIAEAAGVTHAMLHYYFRTKENLYERVMSEKFMNAEKIVMSALGNADLPLVDRIRQGVRSNFDFVFANPDLPYFVIDEMKQNPDHIEGIFNEMADDIDVFFTNLQNQIDESVKKGECRFVDAHVLVLDIVSLNVFTFLLAPMVNRIMKRYDMDREEFLEIRRKENEETILRRLLLD